MVMTVVVRRRWKTRQVRSSDEGARTLFIIVGVETAPPGQREERACDVVVRNVKQLAQVPARLCQIAIRGASCACACACVCRAKPVPDTHNRRELEKKHQKAGRAKGRGAAGGLHEARRRGHPYRS